MKAGVGQRLLVYGTNLFDSLVFEDKQIQHILDSFLVFQVFQTLVDF